jgi:hypothetical protein
MTIKQFTETEAYVKSLVSNPIAYAYNPITYLIFGGQGSVYVSKLEYCPAKKQVKLLSEPKETYKGPVTVKDLMILPSDTEILIEGYPGDDTTPLQWETPDNVEFHDGTIDFQRLLSDEEHKVLFDAQEELYAIMENLKNRDIPAEEIKKIFTTVIKDI